MGMNCDILNANVFPDIKMEILRMRDRPGLKTEQQYWQWLSDCQENAQQVYVNGIFQWSWESLNNNLATIDFMVRTQNYPDTLFYIDVVGYQIRNGEIELSTRHKNWNMIWDFMADLEGTLYKSFKGYLAFVVNGEWLYYPIKKDNPKNNIYMSAERKRNIRKARSVFGDHMTCDKAHKIWDQENKEYELAHMNDNIEEDE